MTLHEEIERVRFQSHSVPDDAAEEMDRIRYDLQFAASMIALRVPPGREQALALTKLEEAMFWANAGISRTNRIRTDDSVRPQATPSADQED